MHRLRESDVRNLRAFLRAIYSPQDHAAFVPTTLRAVLKLIPGELAGLQLVDPTKPDSDLWTHPLEASPDGKRRWERYVLAHPLMVLCRERGESPAYANSTFVSQGQFRQRPAYREVFQLVGMEDCLAFLTPAGERLLLGLAVFRRSWGFSEPDLLLMNLIRPHVVQAHENAMAFMQTRADASRVCETIALSPSGRISVASERAWEAIVAYSGARPPRRDRLPAPVERWFLGAAGPPIRPLILEHGQKRLVLQYLTEWSAKRVVFVEELPARSRGADVAPLGLTPREVEVLMWISEAKTNPEIAVILGTSARTVSKHVEHVLEKLKLENRTAAAAMAFEWRRDRAGSPLTSYAK